MRKGSEVENMLLAEYDYKTDIAVQREEAYEEGCKKIVLSLAKNGMSIQNIASNTGIEERKIRRWLTEN